MAVRPLSEIEKLRKEFPSLSDKQIIEELEEFAKSEIGEINETIKYAERIFDRSPNAKNRKDVIQILDKLKLDKFEKVANKINEIIKSTPNDLKLQLVKSEVTGKKYKLMFQDGNNKGKLKYFGKLLNLAFEFSKGGYVSHTDRIRDNATIAKNTMNNLAVFAMRKATEAVHAFDKMYLNVKVLRREWLESTKTRASDKNTSLRQKHDGKALDQQSLLNIDKLRRGHADRTAKNFDKKLEITKKNDGKLFEAYERFANANTNNELIASVYNKYDFSVNKDNIHDVLLDNPELN